MYFLIEMSLRGLLGTKELLKGLCWTEGRRPVQKAFIETLPNNDETLKLFYR